MAVKRAFGCEQSGTASLFECQCGQCYQVHGVCCALHNGCENADWQWGRDGALQAQDREQKVDFCSLGLAPEQQGESELPCAPNPSFALGHMMLYSN